jgi:hypothetical protein
VGRRKGKPRGQSANGLQQAALGREGRVGVHVDSTRDRPPSQKRRDDRGSGQTGLARCCFHEPRFIAANPLSLSPKMSVTRGWTAKVRWWKTSVPRFDKVRDDPGGSLYAVSVHHLALILGPAFETLERPTSGPSRFVPTLTGFETVD